MREVLSRDVERNLPRLIEMTQALVARGLAQPTEQYRRDRQGDRSSASHHSRHRGAPRRTAARHRQPGRSHLRGKRPGRRLIFNGHLDTFPIGEAARWTVPPLSGELREGRLYGRGVSDMKGGLACSILAAALLAEHRKPGAGKSC